MELEEKESKGYSERNFHDMSQNRYHNSVAKGEMLQVERHNKPLGCPMLNTGCTLPFFIVQVHVLPDTECMHSHSVIIHILFNARLFKK